MKNRLPKNISNGTVLLVSLMGVHLINFVFNAYLGRVLSFEQFGLITIINTFLYIAIVPFHAIYTTVNHKIAYFSGKKQPQAEVSFFSSTIKQITVMSLLISCVWVLAIPFVDSFFQIQDAFTLLLFTPIIPLGVITAANKGFLQGKFHFFAVAIIILIEAISKLLFAWALVNFQLHYWVYITIPLSVLVGYIVSLWVLPKSGKRQASSEKKEVFPKKFFLAALLTGFSSMAFLTCDVLLAKHFLSPTIAGQYALLSLIGKMVYFFGALPNILMMTFISNDEGRNRDPRKSFYTLFSITIIFSLGAFLALGILGQYIVPLLFGKKTEVILPYLPTYAASIAIFAIASNIITYHLAKKQYIFPVIALVAAGILSLGILFFHKDIAQITSVIFYTGIGSLGVIGILHILESYKKLLFVETDLKSVSPLKI